ncbi:50S ribosomal protein L9 [bacterium]|nr:50S ribosomal protein L9 [bacterium]
MEIILIKNIKGLGKVGDIKKVADGYARNFLLPQKLAEPATESAIKKAEDLAKKKSRGEKEKLAETRKLAEKLKGKAVVIKAKEKGGKLFGSIGAKEIAAGLKKMGLEISEKSIVMEKPIKEIGEKEVKVKLGGGVEAKVKVVVEKE